MEDNDTFGFWVVLCAVALALGSAVGCNFGKDIGYSQGLNAELRETHGKWYPTPAQAAGYESYYCQNHGAVCCEIKAK